MVSELLLVNHRQGPPSMKSILLLLPLVIALPAGCAPTNGPMPSHGSTATQVPIVRVLAAEKLLADKHWKSLPPDAKPSQVAGVLQAYCADAQRLDLSACPADFRVAFRHYVAALDEVRQATAQKPDDFAEGVLLGALNSVLLGEADGGAGRIQGNLNLAVERVKATYAEVERIGAKYGAAL
jgi:hypothetical protein